jgi:proteasome accessory factor C
MSRPTAAERARRLLALLGRLKPGTRIPLDDLARELGITPAEVASEFETLSVCGVWPYDPLGLVPVFVDDDAIEVFGEVPALRGPVRLSAREASALAAAMQTAGFKASDPLPSRLLAAASATFDADEVEHVVRASIESHDPSVYETLARASAERRVVTIDYLGTTDDRPVSRDVEPIALFAERGAWYLTAWCRRAGGWRTFRLDRMRTVRASDERFSDARAVSAGSPRAFDPAGLPTARLRFARAEEFTERDWPGAVVAETTAEGAALVDVPFAGMAWIARRVCARLGEVEVLEPPSLRTAVAELAGGERTRAG